MPHCSCKRSPLGAGLCSRVGRRAGPVPPPCAAADPILSPGTRPAPGIAVASRRGATPPAPDADTCASAAFVVAALVGTSRRPRGPRCYAALAVAAPAERDLRGDQGWPAAALCARSCAVGSPPRSGCRPALWDVLLGLLQVEVRGACYLDDPPSTAVATAAPLAPPLRALLALVLVLRCPIVPRFVAGGAQARKGPALPTLSGGRCCFPPRAFGSSSRPVAGAAPASAGRLARASSSGISDRRPRTAALVASPCARAAADAASVGSAGPPRVSFRGSAAGSAPRAPRLGRLATPLACAAEFAGRRALHHLTAFPAARGLAAPPTLRRCRPARDTRNPHGSSSRRIAVRRRLAARTGCRRLQRRSPRRRACHRCGTRSPRSCNGRRRSGVSR